MNTKEILTIIALSTLGLCLLLGLAKMMTKSDKTKKECDQVCNLLFFISVVLIGVSQLLNKPEKYRVKDESCQLSPGAPTMTSCITDNVNGETDDALRYFNEKWTAEQNYEFCMRPSPSSPSAAAVMCQKVDAALLSHCDASKSGEWGIWKYGGKYIKCVGNEGDGDKFGGLVVQGGEKN